MDADPTIVFGRLDNGLRYIVKENQAPADRVSMHLVVQAGSLNETDREQGIAHFLEHMLFNGSTNFPPGEMVKYFQRIGMLFGPDANAHTGFSQTVYDVVLPKGDQKSLAEGLLVLRDYADGALLNQGETERERGVILSEMRSRDSAQMRTIKKSFQFEMPGLLVSQRFPIGDETVLRNLDATMLRKFYTAWYRPERMIVVIVGDMDAESVIGLIEQRFETLQAKAPEPELPEFGQMRHDGTKSFYHFEEEAGSAHIAIETVVQEHRPVESVDSHERALLHALANGMVQDRLEASIKRAESVLTTVRVSSGYFLDQVKYSEIRGTSAPNQWEAALAELERALRRAVTFGFTPAELECAKGEFRAGLLSALKKSNTRDSKQLSQEIIASLNQWRVIQSPQQRWEMLNPILDRITLKEVNAAFAKKWKADHQLVMVTGNAKIEHESAAASDHILAVFQNSRQTAVHPPRNREMAVFPYLPAPAATGTISQRKSIDDIGIEQVRFANGFHLNLKKTAFEEDQVLATLVFGKGLSSEPANKPGLAKLTEAVVNDSGFGQMDFFELEEALAGKVARTQLRIREDMFRLEGETASDQVQLLFELLYAHIQDQGYRETVRGLALKRFEQEMQAMARQPDGLFKLKGEAFLAGGDHRFGFPDLELLQQCSIADIKQWYGDQLRNAPMELSIVGDIEPEAVIAMAARYFGTLPRRDATLAKVDTNPVFPEGQSLRLTVASQIPKAVVVVAYPTEDFWDIQRTRRLAIMAELFSERLRSHIRETLGAAYSPYAYNRSHRAYDQFGFTRIVLKVDPEKVDVVEREVREIAAHLSNGQLDQDEFRRVLDPNLTYIKDLKQKNKYWLNSVLTGAARYPQQLDWCRTFETDYAAITADEIAAYSQRYLDNSKAATVIITP